MRTPSATYSIFVFWVAVNTIILLINAMTFSFELNLGDIDVNNSDAVGNIQKILIV